MPATHAPANPLSRQPAPLARIRPSLACGGGMAGGQGEGHSNAFPGHARHSNRHRAVPLSPSLACALAAGEGWPAARERGTSTASPRACSLPSLPRVQPACLTDTVLSRSLPPSRALLPRGRDGRRPGRGAPTPCPAEPPANPRPLPAYVPPSLAGEGWPEARERGTQTPFLATPATPNATVLYRSLPPSRALLPRGRDGRRPGRGAVKPNAPHACLATPARVLVSVPPSLAGEGWPEAREGGTTTRGTLTFPS